MVAYHHNQTLRERPPSSDCRHETMSTLSRMTILQVFTLISPLLLTACAELVSGENAQATKLHLWLYGADTLIPTQIHPTRGGASAPALGEALRVCGVNHFTLELDALTGERVYLPSSEKDSLIVGCVARHVHFGFNANRITAAEYSKGQEGTQVMPIFTN
jgi:hypothetical protein